MRLLFTECKEDDADYFQAAFQGQDVTTTSKTLAEVSNTSQVEVLSVQVHSRIGAKELQRMPKLRLIVTRSTGLDHINLEEAAKHSVEVRNIPDYGAQTVAEHTLLLLFAIARKLPQAIEITRRGEFDLGGLLGFDLAGKTVVVVGVGNIGERFAKMAQAVGMRVVGVDPAPRKTCPIEYLELNRALPVADALVLCCPLVESTRYLINDESLALLKPSALLVNTARGAVVHAPSLLRALEQGLIGAAALDVLEYEEVLRGNASPTPDQEEILAANRALMSHPRVVVTPHMAFYTQEALSRLRQSSVEIIQDFLRASC
jgi:D-lactate dehydrogenase